MTTFVVDTANVVKLDADDVRCQPPEMATLIERIQTVLDEEIFPSATAWCVAAGVSDKYIATLKSRLSTGEVRQGRSEQIAMLAQAAGVSIEWLMGRSNVRHRSVPPPASGDRPTASSKVGLLDPNLQTALETYEWPVELGIAEMKTVLERLKADEIAAGEVFPVPYWQMHLKRTVAAVMSATPKRRTS